MTWERAVHFVGPIALVLITLWPLTRRRGHHLIDRKGAWLCLMAGAVWSLSVVLRFAADVPDDLLARVADAVSLFFGGILFVYGFWTLRRVRFSLHTRGDDWADRYRRSDRRIGEERQ
jgi:hypothetical protein